MADAPPRAQDVETARCLLHTCGWVAFPTEPAVSNWVASILPEALRLSSDPALRARWLRHGETWFAGVNILGNDGAGRIEGGPPLSGLAFEAAMSEGTCPLDPAQISVAYPGYPRADAGETDAAIRFRRNRDAAHLDGLLPVGSDRRRFILEPPAFVLGIALTEADATASPLVVWEGSHAVFRSAFLKALADVPADQIASTDLTDTYQTTRRTVFDTCARIPVPLRPGEAVLLHRLTLHGIAPWGDTAQADAAGRMIAYFRPDLPGGAPVWLDT